MARALLCHSLSGTVAAASSTLLSAVTAPTAVSCSHLLQCSSASSIPGSGSRTSRSWSPWQQQQQLEHLGSLQGGQCMATLAYEEYYIDKDTLASVSQSAAENKAKDSKVPLTALLLHGLLGSGKNWRSFARGLAVDAAREQSRDVRIVMPDLRNHGLTAHMNGFHPPHTLESTAQDILSFIDKELGGKMPHLLVGLSLGGKVALEVLQQLQQRQNALEDEREVRERDQHTESVESAGHVLVPRPQQVWILDAQPASVSVDDDAPTSVAKIISMLHDVPTPLNSRQQLYQLVQKRGLSQAIGLWLGSNLSPGTDGKLRWNLNIPGAAAMYYSYRLSSYLHLFSKPPPGVHLHFVRGELSDRWSLASLQQLENCYQQWETAKKLQQQVEEEETDQGASQGAAGAQEGEEGEGTAVGELHYHVLAAAGHWLPSDNPEGLKKMMVPWFKELHPHSAAAGQM